MLGLKCFVSVALNEISGTTACCLNLILVQLQFLNSCKFMSGLFFVKLLESVYLIYAQSIKYIKMCVKKIETASL